MRFREYYILETKLDVVFDKSFQKFFKKGFFGSISEDVIKKEQKIWYEKLVRFIMEKNQQELVLALGSIEKKISREYFTNFTGLDIKHKTKQDAIRIIESYIKDNK